MSEVRSLEGMLAEAAQKGCVVIYPKPDELFLDIDGSVDFARYNDALPLFRGLHEVVGITVTPSSSGKSGHLHIIVKLAKPVPDDVIRVYWQALLGSDVKREILALKHLEEGYPPTVFFEKAAK